MYKGSCLCNKIQFEITTQIENIIFCRCKNCQKVQGSAFATNGNVDIKGFKFTKGENNLTSYKHSSTKTKYFCKYKF